MKGVLWQINESVYSTLNGCEEVSERLEKKTSYNEHIFIMVGRM